MTDAPAAARPVRLARSFLTVGIWTAASRVLGFLRDVMIAALLGAGPVADAFFVAFRLPNMFRRFFAEGAFNMAFVPLFAKRLEGEGAESARSFAEETLAVLASALLALTLLAQLFMPALIWLLAAGFADDPERFGLAVVYGRIQFPYLLCMSLTALFSGILNALGRFAAPAAAPVLLNVILIGAMAGTAVLAMPVGGVQSIEEVIARPVGMALAVGVLLAGFAQVGLVLWAARRAGMQLTVRRPRLTPPVRRLLRLGVPAALAGGVLQVNILIGTVIASFFDGAVAWLSYADRLYQLPLGIVGIAIGVVLLPELSRRVRAGDRAGAREAMNRAAEFALVLTLPAAVALLVMPGTIVATLFQRGAFGPDDTRAVALALAVFAVGLPAFVLQKVIQPAFFAREDMKAPLRFAVASVGVNVAVSLLGAPVIGYVAIAVGTTIGGWLNLWLLWRGATGFGDDTALDDRLRHRAPKIAQAAAAMGAALLIVGLALGGGGWLTLGLLILIGASVYAAALHRLGAIAAADVRAALRRG